MNSRIAWAIGAAVFALAGCGSTSNSGSALVGNWERTPIDPKVREVLILDKDGAGWAATYEKKNNATASVDFNWTADQNQISIQLKDAHTPTVLATKLGPSGATLTLTPKTGKAMDYKRIVGESPPKPASQK